MNFNAFTLHCRNKLLIFGQVRANCAASSANEIDQRLISAPPYYSATAKPYHIWRRHIWKISLKALKNFSCKNEKLDIAKLVIKLDLMARIRRSRVAP